MKSHGFSVSIGTIWGTTKSFMILVKKPVRATPLKLQIKKKIQGAKYKKIKNCFWKNVFFMPILYSKKIKS